MKQMLTSRKATPLKLLAALAFRRMSAIMGYERPKQVRKAVSKHLSSIRSN
jgi:hypothetical protein